MKPFPILKRAFVPTLTLLILFGFSFHIRPKVWGSPTSIPANIRFDRLAFEDGLSHNNVWSVAQDARGFMWFGAVGGLNRYDGYSFKVYHHDPEDPDSLIDNAIRKLHIDRSGSLWIGTWAGGLDEGCLAPLFVVVVLLLKISQHRL